MNNTESTKKRLKAPKIICDIPSGEAISEFKVYNEKTGAIWFKGKLEAATIGLLLASMRNAQELEYELSELSHKYRDLNVEFRLTRGYFVGGRSPLTHELLHEYLTMTDEEFLVRREEAAKREIY